MADATGWTGLPAFAGLMLCCTLALGCSDGPAQRHEPGRGSGRGDSEGGQCEGSCSLRLYHAAYEVHLSGLRFDGSPDAFGDQGHACFAGGPATAVLDVQLSPTSIPSSEYEDVDFEWLHAHLWAEAQLGIRRTDGQGPAWDEIDALEYIGDTITWDLGDVGELPSGNYEASLTFPGVADTSCTFDVGVVSPKPGDADCDQDFDSDDIVAMLEAGKYGNEDPATWAEGDFDGDGDFDSDDLVAALGEGVYEAGPYDVAPSCDDECLAIEFPNCEELEECECEDQSDGGGQPGANPGERFECPASNMDYCVLGQGLCKRCRPRGGEDRNDEHFDCDDFALLCKVYGDQNDINVCQVSFAGDRDPAKRHLHPCSKCKGSRPFTGSGGHVINVVELEDQNCLIEPQTDPSKDHPNSDEPRQRVHCWDKDDANDHDLTQIPDEAIKAACRRIGFRDDARCRLREVWCDATHSRRAGEKSFFARPQVCRMIGDKCDIKVP